MRPSARPSPAAPRSPFLRLLGYARPYLAHVGATLAAALVFYGGRIALVSLFKPVLDAASGAAGDDPWSGLPVPGVASLAPLVGALGPGSLAWTVVGVGLVLVLVVSAAHFAREWIERYVLGRILVDLQREFCAKLLVLPLRFHQSARRGDTLARLLSDTTRAHTSLRVFLGDLVPSVIAIVAAAAALLALSWQLTVAALAVAPPVLGVIWFFGRRIRRGARRRQESLGGLTQRLVDILSGIKVIQAFRAEGHEEEAFARENWRFFRRNLRVEGNRVASRASVEALNNAIAVAVLGGGLALVQSGTWDLSLGDLGAFIMILQTTYRPAKDLTKGWNTLQDALPSAERFFDLLDRPREMEEPADAVPFEGLRRGIRVREVTFSYGREPVLRDISLDVGAGQVVALVGRTGAGKTTLADLLLRFYDPDRGAIEVDGVDLRRLDRASFLERVAVVTQEPFLFAGSVWDNIRYGRPGASDEEVRAAAKTAHVDEFVDQLPDGWDTEVGELGAQLSGGQRQRITLARALVRNPDLLILDEATSSLDARSERYVQEALDRLLHGRTVVVIAHRLSTVRGADRIVVLDDGRVQDTGTHDELMARDGLYRELVSIQMGT